MSEVEWSYLNSIAGTIFGFLRIAVTAFGFLQLLSGVFVMVEELFALELITIVTCGCAQKIARRHK